MAVKSLSESVAGEETMNLYAVDYGAVVRRCTGRDLRAALRQELSAVWRDAYLRMTGRPTELVIFRCGSFEYIYDDYATLEATGAVPRSETAEARLVAAIGLSETNRATRDDSRLRGWVGPTERMFGHRRDKGHFVAHRIGGAVDRAEVNVFVQRRDLNRGWSVAGRAFRAMEDYCATRSGVLCFNRPIYLDETATPAYIEFGVLREPDDLWVRLFDNR